MTTLTNYHAEFAQFCNLLTEHRVHTTLLEDSTLLNSPIGKNIGGREVIKKLYDESLIAHNQTYTEIRPRDITWSELRSRTYYSWVFFTGTEGTAAVRSGTVDSKKSVSDIKYILVMSTPEKGQEVSKKPYTSSTQMLADIKNSIGKVTGMYFGKDPEERRQKKAERLSYKKSIAKAETTTPELLLAKFSPLIKKSAVAALANIKGHVMDSIKNDGFDKAQNYIKRAVLIKDMIDHMDYHGDEYKLDENTVLKRVMDNALNMAAGHYYPELTGNFVRPRYSYSTSMLEYTPQSLRGREKLLNDIAGGSTEKIGTVLYYFKMNLVTL